MEGPLPAADGYVILSRRPRRPLADVWRIGLRQPLPTIPIPLSDGEADVLMDLQWVFNEVYDRAGYGVMLDYALPVEPPVDADDTSWIQAVLEPPSST